MATKQRNKPSKKFSEIFLEALEEFLGGVLTVLSIYGIRRLMEFLLGGEVLWGVLPVRYCEDTVDLAVFARIVWRIIKTFNE